MFLETGCRETLGSFFPIYLVVSRKIATFAGMKLQKWILIEILMIAVAIVGLFWLTKSYLMTLGIVILLVLAEHVLVSKFEEKEENHDDETAD